MIGRIIYFCVDDYLFNLTANSHAFGYVELQEFLKICYLFLCKTFIFCLKTEMAYFRHSWILVKNNCKSIGMLAFKTKIFVQLWYIIIRQMFLYILGDIKNYIMKSM